MGSYAPDSLSSRSLLRQLRPTSGVGGVAAGIAHTPPPPCLLSNLRRKPQQRCASRALIRCVHARPRPWFAGRQGGVSRRKAAADSKSSNGASRSLRKASKDKGEPSRARPPRYGTLSGLVLGGQQTLAVQATPVGIPGMMGHVGHERACAASGRAAKGSRRWAGVDGARGTRKGSLGRRSRELISRGMGLVCPWCLSPGVARSC